jgi:hypothetical protein
MGIFFLPLIFIQSLFGAATFSHSPAHPASLDIMRLEALILITAAAVEVSAKTFHMKYPGPLVHTRRKPRQTKAPEVSHLQLNRDAADNREEWEEIVIELDQAVPTKAPSKLETRGDGGKLQGCHGKKCANRFYRESEEEETTTTEHHEDEG